MSERCIVNILSNVLLFISAIQVIRSATEPMTISEFSSTNDYAYVCLFTSIIFVSVYVLVTPASMLHKRCAIMSLFVNVPCKGVLLGMIHIMGVSSVILYCIHLLIDSGNLYIAPLVLWLLCSTIFSVLNMLKLEIVLCECALFYTCSSIVLYTI